eukprot:9478252-Alexandrium_andersonii.AAC.1
MCIRDRQNLERDTGDAENREGRAASLSVSKRARVCLRAALARRSRSLAPKVTRRGERPNEHALAAQAIKQMTGR